MLVFKNQTNHVQGYYQNVHTHIVITIQRIVINLFFVLLSCQLCQAQSWPQPFFTIKERDPKTGEKKDIYSYLGKDIRMSLHNKCSSFWGFFYFRVNSTGKVDSISYRGTVPEHTKKDIIRNIYGTQGHWIIPKHVKPNQKLWFVYPYFEFGEQFHTTSNCPEGDKMLQKNLIGICEQLDLMGFRNSGRRMYYLIPYKIGGPYVDE